MKKAEFKTWSLIVAYAKDSDIPLMTDSNVVSIDIHGSLTQIVNAITGSMANYIGLEPIPKQSLRKGIAECMDNNSSYYLNVEHGGNMLSFRVDKHLLEAGITINTSSIDEKESK